MTQATIFDFINKPKKEYVFVRDLPAFVDADHSVRGPFKEGDVLTEGSIPKTYIDILLFRGIIKPKNRIEK